VDVLHAAADGSLFSTSFQKAAIQLHLRVGPVSDTVLEGFLHIPGLLITAVIAVNATDDDPYGGMLIAFKFPAKL
jgi:hypothetical protein